MNQKTSPAAKVTGFHQAKGFGPYGGHHSVSNGDPLHMPLRLAPGKTVKIFGGPYMDRPTGTFGVKMAVEINRPCDVNIPTRDFHVPQVKDVDAGLLQVLKAIRAGKNVYIGCMGGIGRTGLMMAVLAKAFGEPDPVKYVRATYKRHAVETIDQQNYIAKYKIGAHAKWLVWTIRLQAKLLRKKDA